MIHFFKKPIYMKILFARIISVFGDVLLHIFVYWNLFEQTKSINELALIISGSLLLRSFFSFIAGKITDTFNRKKVLVLVDAVYVIVLILFFITYKLSSLSFVIASAFLLLCSSFLNTCFSVSFMSFVADVVDKKNIIQFRALINTATKIVTAGGSAIAGYLVSLLSVTTAVIIDIATFVFSAVLVASIVFIPVKQSKDEERNGEMEQNTLVKQKLTEAINFVRQNIFKDPLIKTLESEKFFAGQPEASLPITPI